MEIEVGSKIYYINSGNEIDTYIIYQIEEIDNEIRILMQSEIMPDIKSTFALKELPQRKRLFFDLEKAKQFQKEQQEIDLKRRMVYHYEAESDELINKIVEYCNKQRKLSTCESCKFNPGKHGQCLINASHFNLIKKI